MGSSKYFSELETRCHGTKCCGKTSSVSPFVLAVADEIRERVGGPVKASCFFRCLVHNRSIGSTDTSQHPQGRAADLHTPSGFTVDSFGALCVGVVRELGKQYGFTGAVLLYPWGCHVDVREGSGMVWKDNR